MTKLLDFVDMQMRDIYVIGNMTLQTVHSKL